MNETRRNLLKKSGRRLDSILDDLLDIYNEEDGEMFWFHRNIRCLKVITQDMKITKS